MTPSFISADELRAYLDAAEAGFDSRVGLYQRPGYDNGYHTRLTSRDMTHPTRDNFDYAIALLLTGEKTARARAISMVQILLPLQDRLSTNATYGVWPWFWEEPLGKMSPPDWNWADFCGLRTAQILRRHAEGFPLELISDLTQALGHAAYSIFRRNAPTAYTNIAIMGGCATLIASEMLSDARLESYGLQRLRNVHEALDLSDGFAEYNSPNYTMEIVNICERALYLLEKPELRRPVEELHRRVWGLICDFFHPGMGQWGGPQSRSYQTWLEPGQVDFLSRRLGFQIEPRPGVVAREGAILGGPSLFPELPCPPEWVERFRRLPEKVVTQTKRFLPSNAPRPPVNGTSWMTADAALGSVNRALMWVQTRSVLGYWKTVEDPAVQFRLRFLHDGKDFSSAFNFNVQKGPHVLVALGLILDGGSLHPNLDKPAQSIFSATDFRLRFELLGQGITARKTEHGFVLAAGGHRVAILPGLSVFDGRPIAWELHEVENGWAVDGVCHAGERLEFPFKEIKRTLLCAGLSLLCQDQPDPSETPRLARESDDLNEVAWRVEEGELSLQAWSRPRAENP